MVIDINEQFKIFGIWLTKEESQDQKIKQKIQPLLFEHKKEKYMPVIYISGTRDFIEQTGQLLNHNKNL